jgi:ApbE superfamily uncharacterized protein (UPF0280 family)
MSTSENENRPIEILPDLYRSFMKSGGLVTRRIVIKQTNILVAGLSDLELLARGLVEKYRNQIEGYIVRHPNFLTTLKPERWDPFAPDIIQSMINATAKTGVGPMASVAGAIAEYVGWGLLAYSREVIVENGGDIFIRSERKIEVLLLAESSEFLGVRIAIQSPNTPMGLCTSSGKLGPSLSLGKADAVMTLATSATLADAAATAIGNLIHDPEDIWPAMELGQKIGLEGLMIIASGHIGMWGKIELIG